MTLPVASIPSSVTVTNNTQQVIFLGPGAKLAAGQVAKVINLAALSADVKAGPGLLAGASPREQTWQAIVELARARTGGAPVTIVATTPDILPLDASAYTPGGAKTTDSFVHDGLANH